MWSKVLGHKRQIEQLKRIAESGQIPPAYLFSGLDGIGKYLIATVFAKSLFCSNSPEVCEKCTACSKIENRLHPDVFFIEPKKDRILIDQIRDLKKDLQFHPLEGRLKLTIINDAEKMTDSAANSLLKILEEPPSKTHFILVSAFPNRLLPTIRSRCQHITFSPLTKDQVSDYLMNNIDGDEKIIEKIALISQGSIGAVRMMDGEFMEEVWDRFENLLAGANTADIISLAEIWAKEEDRAHLVLDLLASFYRNILYERSIGGKGLAKNMLAKRPLRRLENDFLAITNARYALLNTTANKQLLFEQLLFTLTSV